MPESRPTSSTASQGAREADSRHDDQPFQCLRQAQQELETAKSQLDDRKAIDRAKALVMRARAIPEEQAYALMRHVAMNENKKIADVARSIITAAELLR
jgi:response regulator NasT